MDDLGEPVPRVREEEAAVVRKTVETTTTLRVPVRDLCRALGLPKWGRLTLGNLHVKREDGTYAKFQEAAPAFDEDEGSGSVTFTHYRSKSTRKRLR